MKPTKLDMPTRLAFPKSNKPKPVAVAVVSVSIAQAYRDSWKRLHASLHPAMRQIIDLKIEGAYFDDFVQRVIKEAEKGME